MVSHHDMSSYVAISCHICFHKMKENDPVDNLDLTSVGRLTTNVRNCQIQKEVVSKLVRGRYPWKIYE